MQIVMAHPSFPWQDEALSVALHKPNVWIDLSGWSPKYFPRQLVQYANTLLKDRVLFGSDYPLITPERWMKEDRKSTRLNSSHLVISYAVFCWKKTKSSSQRSDRPIRRADGGEFVLAFPARGLVRFAQPATDDAQYLRT